MAFLRRIGLVRRPGLKSRATDGRPIRDSPKSISVKSPGKGRPSVARDFNPGRRGHCALFLLLVLLLAAPGAAPAQTAGEYEVKAAFLYNFTKFVDWPATAFPDTGSFKVCVLGDDPFGGNLEAIVGEQVGSRRLKVVRTDSISRSAGCQILFISHSEHERLPQILAAVKGTPVLTVGDSKGFAEEGVIVNFILEGTRVRFEINTVSADQAGLQISSKLLQLAKRLVPGP